MLISNKKNFLFNKIKKKFKNYIVVKKKYFNNKESYVEIKNIKKKKIFFLICFSKNINNEIIEMLMVLYILKKISITICLPYFPYCRQDKKKKKIKNCLSFQFIIFLLKNFNIKKIITFDIHTNILFNSYGIKFKNIKTISFIKKIIKKYKNLSLAFTDFGCFKRYFEILHYVNDFLIFKKNRIKNKINLDILYKNKIKKNILIIDDIMDSGNTLYENVNYIKSKFKINKILIYVTHLLNYNSVKRFNNIKIYTTDTFFSKKKKKIKIFSVSKLI